jgi:hypothetical protein
MIMAQERKLKKISVDVVKPEAGDKIEGTLKGKTTGPWIDKTTGEQKELTRIHFERDDGSRFVIFEDAGLKNALSNAMVQDGQYVQLVKGEKLEMNGGRSVNQWEVFA